MPAAQGQSSSKVLPALSAENSDVNNSFVAAAPPVVAASFKVKLLAVPGEMTVRARKFLALP
jgi:hypothetical protein